MSAVVEVGGDTDKGEEMRFTRIAAAAALAALGIAVGAGAAPKGTTVRTYLKEFKVTPVPAKVKPGSVTFSVKNIGHLKHSFVVLKTSVAPSKLRKKGQVAIETGLIARIPQFGAGQTRTLTINLKAGKYVLICNLPGHYAGGQYASFTVG